MEKVDLEVEHLVNLSYAKGKDIVLNNIPLLHHLAQTLLKQETVSSEEFNLMLLQFNAKTADYDIFEKDNADDFQYPFQNITFDYVI